MKHCIILSIVFFASATPLYAATMMAVSNSDSGDSRIWIDDKYARMDTVKSENNPHAEAAPPAEMIIDLKHKKLYAIDHNSKTLVDMSNFSMPGQPHSSSVPVKLSFDKQGRGPDVAGFATQQYSVSADGQKCYKALFSKDVLKNKHIVAFYDAMMNTESGNTNNASPCEAADNQIYKMSVEKYGMALKVMDTSGKTVFEIKQIKAGISPPSHYLELPAGYKKKTMLELMQQQMPMPPATK